MLGTAAPAATVRVNDEPATQRNGTWFYHELALDGTGSPGYYQFPVSATQLQGTPPTSELVRSETRKTFVPASPESYTHDPDGNLTQDGRWVNTYDAENRLIKQETRADIAQATGLPRQRLAYTYDANGRRIAKKVETYNPATTTWDNTADTRYLYDGWNLAAELDYKLNPTYGSTISSYVWGLDLSGTMQGAGGVGGLLWATTGTTSHAPAYDGNGNIIAWIDLATGTKVSETDYDAFGNVIQISGTNPTPFGFSTKYLDSETGLNYYGFRYYNPSTGRWLSKDPIEEDGGLNLYGMVNNDSVNLWDYLGQSIKVDLKFIPGHPQDVPVSYVNYGSGGVGVIRIKGNTVFNYLLDCYCTSAGDLECKLTASFRIQLQKGMSFGDIVGTYGHEQRHVSSLMYEIRLIAAELKDEKNCCSDKDKVEKRYNKKLKNADDRENDHDNTRSPIAGATNYPIIGNGNGLFSVPFE